MSKQKSMGFTHDNKNNATHDWWTPPWIFETLGLDFDLDPASPEGGVPWIPAKKIYTAEEDGLIQDWQGMVWLNPPYGKHTSAWLNKMHQHRNGIALLFARTDCRWFHDFVIKADAILFLKGRVSFIDAQAITKSQGAGAGSMLIAWGKDCVDALDTMSGKGILWEVADS